jgi:hypothetical protein
MDPESIRCLPKGSGSVIPARLIESIGQGEQPHREAFIPKRLLLEGTSLPPCCPPDAPCCPSPCIISYCRRS